MKKNHMFDWFYIYVDTVYVFFIKLSGEIYDHLIKFFMMYIIICLLQKTILKISVLRQLFLSRNYIYSKYSRIINIFKKDIACHILRLTRLNP